MKTISTIEELTKTIKDHDVINIVFSTKSCSVCKPLKSKLEKILEYYPSVPIYNVFLEDLEQAKGLHQVFSAPITLLFVQGKEAKRYSAAMDLNEFKQSVDRYVKLLES